MKTLENVLTVARREFTVRARTRSYQIGTVVIVIGVLLFALLPVFGRLLVGGQAQKVAITVSASNLPADPQQTFTSLLNASSGQNGTGTGTYTVVMVPTADEARQGVSDGTYAGALAIGRSADGELTYTYYSKNQNSVTETVTSALVRQSAQAYAVADRMARLGIDPAQQAELFAPVAFDTQAADPNHGAASQNFLIGFGVSILVFMTVVLYGSWIAMSVVEEKSSRVVEVVLNAATPFQLLTGKVIGVGGLALLQYVLILIAGGVALVLQVPISNALLGGSAAPVDLPSGLSVGLLVLVGVFGVLGFLLYSVLFAAAGSLASRQEDVNQVIMPMMLLATAGYLVAIWANIGVIDPRSSWIGLMALFPFFSPFMILSRFANGDVGLLDVTIAIALLSLTILGALWLAARIYSAGVLLYGQRPGIRRVWQVVRTGT